MAQCTAKSKRTKKRCRRHAMIGRETCPFHGGKSRRGLTHPSFTKGLFSKDLPSHLQGIYNAVLNDQDLVSLKHHMALLDTRLVELVRTLGKQVSTETWNEVLDSLDRFEQAKVQGNIKNMQAHINAVQKIAASKSHDGGVWSDILVVMAERRKLTVAEAKIVEKRNYSIMAPQAMALIANLSAAVNDGVRKHIKNEALAITVLTDIGTTFRKYLGPASPGPHHPVPVN